MGFGAAVSDGVTRCSVRSRRCIGVWRRIRGLVCDVCGVEACGRCVRYVGRSRVCVDCARGPREVS